MNATERMSWFKQHFGAKIAAETAGTPITVDLVTAIANQETGYLWPRLLEHHDHDVAEVLRDCVGDTLDYPRRNAAAFPKNKAELLNKPFGEELFSIAREALGRIGEAVPAYGNVYDSYPDKFCHGFGILQYDIQHVLTDEDFFLEQQWADFDICLARCLTELQRGLRVRGYEDATELTDFELATVAIVYNTGRYRSSRGLRQGHKSGGKYYGEWIKDYLAICRKIDLDHDQQDETDLAVIVPEIYVVTARSGLNLRGGPGTDFAIKDTIAEGTEVSVLAFMGAEDAWALVDLEGDGGRDGFMYAEFLFSTAAHEADADSVEDVLRAELAVKSGAYSAPTSRDAKEHPD